jgi:hypothetical protein
MDQLIRLLGHHPAAPGGQEAAPDRFWVASNVASFFGPDDTYGDAGYGGNAFIEGFQRLWRR